MDHDKYWRCLENVLVTDLQLSSTFINYNINIDNEVETNQSLHVSSFEILSRLTSEKLPMNSNNQTSLYNFLLLFDLIGSETIARK